MAYTNKVSTYTQGSPPVSTAPETARLYLEAELRKLRVVLDSQAKVIAEIQSKLAAASSLPIT